MRQLALAAAMAALVSGAVGASDANLVQSGKEIYTRQQCARCHMVGGKGYKHGKLDGVASKMNADDMRKWLTKPAEMEAKLAEPPKVKMSSRKRMKLTDADVTALVAYLMTLRQK
jgi:mono/diheme cytochrome c family protein